MGHGLPRGFYAHPTVRVARALLGCVLHVDKDTPDHVAAQIVEVEAYRGLADPASHAARGPTPRAAIMFGQPGHLYVYLSYGVHTCANVVTERDGVAGAVLLRAAAVVSGEDVVRRRRGRGGLSVSHLLRGPGNLCRGLGIDRGDNAADLCAGGGRFQIEEAAGSLAIVSGARVGISQASDLPLRFGIDAHPAVSAPPIRRAPRAATLQGRE